MIETIVDKKKDLTIHKCSGSLTDEEFKEAIQSFYDGNPTMNVIWDFSKASLADTPTITVKQSSVSDGKKARICKAEWQVSRYCLKGSRVRNGPDVPDND